MNENRKTINRGLVSRRVKAGLVLTRCKFSYTDDYAWDAEDNDGKIGWLKANDLFIDMVHASKNNN